MKRVKRMLALLLISAMMLGLSVPAVADYKLEENAVVQEKINNADFLQKAYNGLSPEAKAIFDQFLAMDEDLLALHKEYVDSSYELPAVPYAVASATSDTLTYISNELAALGLSTNVIYYFESLASGMIAAVVDGVLPVGDILLAAAAIEFAIAIAQEWYDVVDLWNDIVEVFKEAFTANRSNVNSAFSTLHDDVEEEVAAIVIVRGRELTVNGVTYVCNDDAQDITITLQTSGRHYPAVLWQGTVMICTTPISSKIARLIMIADNGNGGVWSSTSTLARSVCGNDPIWHQYHQSNEGYFYHYHMRKLSNPGGESYSHSWYL